MGSWTDVPTQTETDSGMYAIVNAIVTNIKEFIAGNGASAPSKTIEEIVTDYGGALAAVGDTKTRDDYVAPSSYHPWKCLQDPTAVLTTANWSQNYITHKNNLKIDIPWQATRLGTTETVTASADPTLTASGSVFSAGDVGKRIWMDGIVRKIQSYASGTEIEMDDLTTVAAVAAYLLDETAHTTQFTVESITDDTDNVLLTFADTPETEVLFTALAEMLAFYGGLYSAFQPVLKFTANYGTEIAADEEFVITNIDGASRQLKIANSDVTANYSTGTVSVEIYPCRVIDSGKAHTTTKARHYQKWDAGFMSAGAYFSGGGVTRGAMQGHIVYTLTSLDYSGSLTTVDADGSVARKAETGGYNNSYMMHKDAANDATVGKSSLPSSDGISGESNTHQLNHAPGSVGYSYEYAGSYTA